MTPKENLLRVVCHSQPAWVPCGLEGVLREIELNLVEWPEQPGTDVWGVGWDLCDPAVGAYPVSHPVSSLDDVDRAVFPDFSTVAYKSPAPGWFRAPDRHEYLLMGRVGETLFERAWMLMGMEPFMMALHENPGGVKCLLRRIADVRAVMIERHIAAGCEAVMFADDYGGQDCLLISPEAWREFIRPELARLYARCKAAGLLIAHHTCGGVAPILPDLVAMGLDIWHPCQPASNDLAALKRQLGARLTFYGAVDSTVLARGTPDAVRAEVRLRIEQLAAGGGYIAAPSHGVPFPPENVAAMQQEIRRAGKQRGASAER
jgi:uroporphyrinogen decarboxylase